MRHARSGPRRGEGLRSGTAPLCYLHAMAARAFLPLRFGPLAATLTVPTEIPGADAAALTAAAGRLLAALPVELRAKVTKPFADPERLRWNFVPGNYPCVQLQ